VAGFGLPNYSLTDAFVNSVTVHISVSEISELSKIVVIFAMYFMILSVPAYYIAPNK
jgi:hypothetical protein